VKIPSDERVGDVPGGVHYHAQGLGLESFQDLEAKFHILNNLSNNTVLYILIFIFSTAYDDISIQNLYKTDVIMSTCIITCCE
jgi:hypothetical protein